MKMTTRLDDQIEQLQRLVEMRLALCQVARNGVRCTLPENHHPAQEHRFTISFPGRIATREARA
jgi:hypothetical protein